MAALVNSHVQTLNDHTSNIMLLVSKYPKRAWGKKNARACLKIVKHTCTQCHTCNYCIHKQNLIQKQSSCKNSVWLLLGKKKWNPKWRQRNGCDGRLKAKILISTIQVNLCCLLYVSLWFGTKFTWIVIIKFFVFSLPSQPFLGRHFGFHMFFHNRGHTFFFFTSLAVFGLDFTSFCNCILYSWQITCLLLFVLFFIDSCVKSFDIIMYMHFTVLFLYKICA